MSIVRAEQSLSKYWIPGSCCELQNRALHAVCGLVRSLLMPLLQGHRPRPNNVCINTFRRSARYLDAYDVVITLVDPNRKSRESSNHYTKCMALETATLS